MPKIHWDDIETCQTLQEAMDKMFLWASDTKVHTEKIEQRLKQINKGTSLTQDRHILSQQIKLITQLIETDKRYYARVPAFLGHTAKYHSPDMYMRIHDEVGN